MPELAPERMRVLLQELNLRHFEGRLREPNLLLSRRLRASAGMADYWNWTVKISIPYHDLHGWDGEFTDTLLHEMIHLWLSQAGRPAGHGPEFRAMARKLGCPRYAKRMPPRRALQYRCGTCGREVEYRRKVRLACRPCCDRFNGGRFSKKFLLVPSVREPVLFPSPGSSAVSSTCTQ